MKKWFLAITVVLATMLIAPGSALAGATHIPTNVIFDGEADAGDGTTVYSGHVESPNRRCAIGAFMGLVADDEFVDLDFTSFNGAWAMKTDPTGVSTLEARVQRFRFGRKGHRKICDPDAVAIPLA